MTPLDLLLWALVASAGLAIVGIGLGFGLYSVTYWTRRGWFRGGEPDEPKPSPAILTSKKEPQKP